MNAKFTLALLLVLSSLTLFACSSSTGEETTAQVQLASEDAPAMPLTASFLSESGTFTYHISYDGNAAALVAGGLEGASQYGASFKLTGSAEVTVRTGLLNDLEFTDVLSTLEVVNGREFYRYAKTDEACHYEFAGTVYDREEGLVLQMRACEGEDAEVGLSILEDMMAGLALEAAPASMLE